MSNVTWWASGATRRIPIAAAGGVAVIMAPPHRSGSAWSMIQTYATANRAVGDLTLTLSARAEYNSAEAWATLRVTANRLIGLHFADPQGRVYRITAQTAGAAITFLRADDSAGGLGMALTAEATPIFIQADFPQVLSKLMLGTTGADIQFAYGKINPLATDYNTLFNGQSKLFFDTDHSTGGVPARNLYLIGAVGATTGELECYAA